MPPMVKGCEVWQSLLSHLQHASYGNSLRSRVCDTLLNKYATSRCDILAELSVGVSSQAVERQLPAGDPRALGPGGLHGLQARLPGLCPPGRSLPSNRCHPISTDLTCSLTTDSLSGHCSIVTSLRASLDFSLSITALMVAVCLLRSEMTRKIFCAAAAN
eukprot:scaffold107650_cov39-Prasinocladus_malaysianus.AAC.4